MVVQRVREARVEVDSNVVGSIGIGLLVLLGVEKSDGFADADWLVGKLTELRIFNDAEGKMNLSVRDVGGSLLIVSQFTLYGDCRKGRRPSYDRAAPPEQARELYEYVLKKARETGVPVEAGIFQASMAVYLCNEGPVTLILDSPAANQD
jgi:D-tyrosyl-tRNA(Tyr) deacylase